MRGPGAHTTHVAHLPHAGLWQPYCDQCGDIGPGQKYEADAHGIAERHQERQGWL
jgi:hypothetical protein